MLMKFIERLRTHLVIGGETEADMLTAVLDIEPDYLEGLIADLGEAMRNRRKEFERELRAWGLMLTGPAPDSMPSLLEVRLHRTD